MNFETKKVLAKSDDGEAGECDSASPTPVTVPKKRQFSNSDKPNELISSSWPIGKDGEDENTQKSNAVKKTPIVSSGRRRSPRDKLKLTQTVEATRKGRERPKKSKTDLCDHKPSKKANNKTGQNKRTFTKMQYTTEERERIIKAYYENGRSRKNAYRALRKYFGVHNRPSEPTISKLVQKFERTGSVCNVKTTQRARIGRSDENIDRVRESVAGEPGTSIRRRSQQLGISYSTTRRILTNDLQHFTT